MSHENEVNYANVYRYGNVSKNFCEQWGGGGDFNGL